MIKTRFIFTVSFMAMFVINAAVAAASSVTSSAPVSGTGQAISGTVGTVGDVYDWSQWQGYATEGIASVSYVNKAVDAAGNAAQWAESHAAAAGTSAKSAAGSAAAAAVSAQSANDALENKVDKATLEGYATKQYVDGQITSLSQGNATEINALKQSVSDLQDTAVTHSGDDVGSATRPVWVDGGVATAVSGISVPFKQNGQIQSWAEIWIE